MVDVRYEDAHDEADVRAVPYDSRVCHRARRHDVRVSVDNVEWTTWEARSAVHRPHAYQAWAKTDGAYASRHDAVQDVAANSVCAGGAVEEDA